MTAAHLESFRRAGEDLWQGGLIAPGGGNLSIWTPEGVLITREAAALHRLEAADLCLIARATEPPVAPPSLDTPIHRGVYVTAGGKAIVHATPAYAVALTFGQPFFEPPDVEGGHLLGRVPVVSSKRSVIDVIANALVNAPIVIVEGHGSYARGATLADAVRLSAVLEASARIAWLRAVGEAARGAGRAREEQGPA